MSFDTFQSDSIIASHSRPSQVDGGKQTASFMIHTSVGALT